MQRDVKIGIVIGVLIIALVAIFWWARNSGQTPVIPSRFEDIESALPPPVEPVAPVGIGPESGALESPVFVPVFDPEAQTRREGPPVAPPIRELQPPPQPVVPQVAQPVGPRPAAVRTHTVKQGESLSSIAKQYYGSEGKRNLIHEANRSLIGNDPNMIKTGWVLVIPNLPESDAVVPIFIPVQPTPAPAEWKHTVKRGDTLSSIAKKYYGSNARVKVGLIYKANLSLIGNDPNKLKPGWVLVIPREE